MSWQETSRASRPLGRRRPNVGRRVFWSTVLFFVALAGMGVARTWTRTAVLDRMYRLEQARAENARLGVESERLQLELAALERPARVDRTSQEKLNLRPPPPERVVVVPVRQAALPPANAATRMASYEQEEARVASHD